MLKGELVNENSREEPVCSKYSERLVVVNVGALPHVLRGELVNRNSREEPVCLKYSEGLVVVNVGALSPVLRGELVNMSNWAHGTVAGWRRGLNWSNS